MRLQREMHAGGVRPVPRLEELLLRKGLATKQDITKALAERKREIRYCPRCQVLVMSEVRPDAAWSRCADCLGPLVIPPDAANVTGSDSSFVNLNRDPVPPDVQAVIENRSARFGKYIILRELGHGGVGVVYQAWDTYLVQYVAIKRIQPTPGRTAAGDREGRIQSLVKEARSAIRLRHPGIVTIFDIGRINREFYISMEYVEGETLERRLIFSQRLGRRSPYYENPRSVLRMLSGVARAVHYAHTRPQPIVHCDLKPGNILLDQKDRPHVLDFGLARNLRVEADDNEKIAGSPAYMAPEQIMGQFRQIDVRTDVYAMGAILYEVLTGKPPFWGDLKSVLGRALTEAPRPPSEVIRDQMNGNGPAIAPELEDLCLRCLEKTQEHRPQSMGAVAEVLERTDRDITKTRRLDRPTQRVTVPPPDAGAPPAPPPARTPPTPAPAPAPAPPVPQAVAAVPAPRSRRGLLIAACAVGILAIGTALGWMLSPRRPETTDQSFDVRARRITDRIAEFQPDLARAEAETLRTEVAGSAYELSTDILIEEARWVGQVRDRVIERMQSLTVKELKLHGETLVTTGIARVDGTGLTLAGSGRVVVWSDLDPRQILDLARRALGNLEARDQLGLGIYCLRAGLNEDARGYLVPLQGGTLGVHAGRYLQILETFDQAR